MTLTEALEKQESEQMDKYSITTFKAGELLKKYKVRADSSGTAYISYEIDFTNPRERRNLIKITDDYEDTALFYQIRKALGIQEGISEWNEDSLKQVLFFMDFGRLFDALDGTEEERNHIFSAEELLPASKKISREYRLRVLFERGISISYGVDRTVHYVPFDKSSSMSRQSKISFIDEALLPALNHRLNLDLAFPKPVNLSKFYAYRGLYMTRGDRVDLPEGRLNSSSVIVINEEQSETKGMFKRFTGELEDSGILEIPKEQDEKIKIQLKQTFDGEGLISFQLAQEINERLSYKGATSFQIRMPFVKGMLHTVDFRGFIRDTVGDVDAFFIEDAFGVQRDLLKADIILPQSMFKCLQWLKDEMPKAACMDYYFEKFAEYDHALYISNTDLIYGKSNLTRLNYQFLNTLDLEKDEISLLIEGQKTLVRNPLQYLQQTAGEKPSRPNEEDISDDSFDDGNLQRESAVSWEKALLLNPALAQEKYVKEKLKGISNGLTLACANGRLSVKGENRYLSRDLLAFLIWLVELHCRTLADATEVKNVIGKLKDACLKEDKFFMPCPLINLQDRQDYPVFRSPHLSRNEQWLLRPYLKGKGHRKEDYYYKYFSHLKGIVMVSFSSPAPAALGGADFDGDIVKVIDDERIRKAVFRGAYDEKSGERKLSIVEIPSKGHADKYLTDRIDFDVIRNTFSNRIGQISNLSIRLGEKEYGEGAEKVEPEHTCAACTLLTGLEIDAAKTGIHPDLKKILEYGKKEDGEYYYTDFKETIDAYVKNSSRLYFAKSQVAKKNGRYQFKSNPKRGKTDFEYPLNKNYRPIDQLPGAFFELVLEGVKLPTGKKENYFDFQKNRNWKELDEDICRKLRAIEMVYIRLNELASAVDKFRRDISSSRFEGYIKTVLEIQYDQDEYEQKSSVELAALWDFLDEKLDTLEKAESALQQLEESNWPFLMKRQKDRVIRKLLGKEAGRSIREILSNFDSHGYRLFYYALHDVIALREYEMTDDELAALGKVETKNSEIPPEMDMAFYYEFYQEMYKKYLSWREEKNCGWRRRSFAICRRKIDDLLYDVREDQRLAYLYLMCFDGNPDKDEKFFWEYLSPADIEFHLLKAGA